MRARGERAPGEPGKRARPRERYPHPRGSALLRGWIWGLAVGAIALTRGEELRIATYNFENYGPADRVTVAGYRQNYPKPEDEKTALRQVIRDLGADILIAQEMGGQAYVAELRRDLANEGCRFPHSFVAEAVDEDRHLAVFSRRPLRAVKSHRDLTFNYLGGRETVKRGLLEIVVETSAGDLTLFAVHLKSRFTERADDPLSAARRAGEATAIRDLILKRFPRPAEAKFVILGDCNDGRSSKAVGFLQKRGGTRVAVLLSAADSRGEVWSHFYRREETYTRVDQILVSPGLAGAVRAARIYDGPGVDKASDHRPVYVDLVLGVSSALSPRPLE